MSNAAPPSRVLLALAFATVYVVWGSTYLAIRIGVETLPPFLLAAVRFALAGALLYWIARAWGAPRPTRTEWRETAVIGTLMLCGGNGLVCWAEEHIPSGSAALFIAMVPLFMVLLDAWWFRATRLDGLTLVGVAAGIIGIGLLVAPGDGSAPRLHLGGAAALIAAGFFWAIGSLRSRGRRLPDSLALTTAMEMLGGAGSLALLGTLTGEWQRLDVHAVSPASLLALLYLALFGSIAALTAYGWLLRNTTAAAVSTYAFVNPVVALLLGWSAAGEQIGSRTMFSALLVVAGVVMIHCARNFRRPTVQECRVVCERARA